MMQPRTLGSSGIAVSAMGVGCWAVGGPLWQGDRPFGWGEVDDRASVRAIRRAVDLGITFFDTADLYGAGHSEEVLGRALARHRDRVVIATKWGHTFDPVTRQRGGTDTTPGYVRRALEASLRRLGTDHVDLYQFHVADASPPAALEVRELLEQLVVEGRIRAYGWSTYLVDRAGLWADGPNCASVQHELSVFKDAPEMLRFCQERGLASINLSPLAMGLLSGKFDSRSRLGADDVRGKEPGWMRYFKDGRPVPAWLARLDAVRDVLTSGGRTLAQGALAWNWARSGQTIPIPGFRTVAQVEGNAAALRLGPLSPAQMAEIARLLDDRRSAIPHDVGGAEAASVRR
jgi:aryl-alcohol dehydrogenase-like predicted oxidoreductase